MYYNKFYSGNLIAMPQPLYEDGVEYLDGTKASKDQMAIDVTTFLAWASEPELEERKQLGVTVILFLIVFSILSYFSMRQIWAPIKNIKIKLSFYLKTQLIFDMQSLNKPHYTEIYDRS